MIRGFLKRLPGLRPAVIWGRSLRNGARQWFLRCVAGRDGRRMRALHNAHKGQRAWVIGNGPSLTRLDLSLLADELTLGCNGLFLLFGELGWQPAYYLVEDCFAAEDNAEAINNIHGPVKVFPRDLRRFLAPDDNTVYVDFVRGEYPGFPRFSEQCDRVMYWGGTVAYMMLQMAHWLGCNPIYLVGMDMSYRVPDRREGTTIVSREADVNHFHPDYFGPGKRWHEPNVKCMQRCLGHALESLQAKGVEVYNATRGGKLERFPRVAYESVFREGELARETRETHERKGGKKGRQG